jgi:exonuclease III
LPDGTNTKYDTYRLKICSYNVNGLFNKLNHPYFFNYLSELDVFCCLETHIFKLTKQTQIAKYFPNFNLHWSLAERRTDRGRGIAGKLIGWKKNLTKQLGFSFTIECVDPNLQELIIKDKDQTIVRILPVYLRSETWQEEFQNLQNHIRNSGTQNLIIIGDCNVRLGELSQEYVEEVHAKTNALEKRRSEDKIVNSRGRNGFLH